MYVPIYVVCKQCAIVPSEQITMGVDHISGKIYSVASGKNY